MFVIKKLRLNKFVERPIVSNRSLFLSIGEKPASIDSKDTSDCFSEPTVEGASKTKVLGMAAEIIKTGIEKHESSGTSKDMDIKNAKDF